MWLAKKIRKDVFCDELRQKEIKILYLILDILRNFHVVKLARPLQMNRTFCNDFTHAILLTYPVHVRSLHHSLFVKFFF